MSVIVLLIVAGGVVAAGFLGAFVWAVQSGQFDDTCTPAVRMLLDDGGRPQQFAEALPKADENAGDTRKTMSTESRGCL